MEKHTINIDVNTQKANADVNKLDQNLTDLNKTVDNLADTMDMDLGAAVSEMEDRMYALAAAGQKNTEEFKQLVAETGRLKSIIAETDMEIEFLAATSADVGQKIGLLEDRMYAMAVAGDTTSAEFKRIQAEAAALKQSVMQVDMALDGMAMTTTQKLSGSLGGAVGAFGAAQGAMASFGVESQKVNEALLKVQGALAMIQGVQAVQEAIPAMTALKTTVVNGFQSMTAASKAFMLAGIGILVLGIQQLVTNWDSITEALGAATAAQRINNRVQQEATAAISKELNAADKLSVSLKDETLNRSEKVKLIKQFQADYPSLLSNINLEKDSINSINKQLGDNIKLLQLQAEAKALASVREETYAKKTKLQLDLQQEALENASNWTIDYGKSAENGFLGFSTASENAAKAAKKFTDIQNGSTKTLDRQIKSIDQSEKALLRKINALKKTGAATGELSAEEQKAADKAKEAEEEAKRRAEEARDRAKQRAEELAQLKKDELAKITEAQREYDENERTRYMTEQQLEIDAVQKKYAELLAIAAKYGRDNSQLLINQKNEENAINAKYEQERIKQKEERDAIVAEQQEANRQAQLDAEEAFAETYRQATTSQYQLEIDAANEKYFELITLAEQYGYDTVELKKRQEDELAAIDKKYKDEQAAREKEIQSLKIDAVQNGLNTIASLADLFAGKSRKSQERAFKVQKAVSIANATIDTYKAATSAYASLSGITIVGPVLGAVAAAAAVAAGLANIKKIASTKFDGGEGGGAGVSASVPASGGNITAPNFNIVGGNTANQLATLGQQPVQAYVVSGEVSTAQSLDRNRVQNATL